MAKKSKRKGRSAAFMRSINPYLKNRRIKSKTKRSMAKKYKKSRRKRRSSSVLGVNMGGAAAAVAYGALRAKVSTMVAPYTSKISLGNISDEAGMLLIATLGKKFLFKKAGILRDAMTAGQTIELARIGDAFASGEVSLGALSGSSSSTSDGSLW